MWLLRLRLTMPHSALATISFFDLDQMRVLEMLSNGCRRTKSGGVLMRFILAVALCAAGLFSSVSASYAQNQARCDAYWVERNTILKTYHYCFRSPRAAFHFGNAGCLYDRVAAAPLPPFERNRLTEIRAMETGLRCPSRRAS
jgi:hypothetical protein